MVQTAVLQTRNRAAALGRQQRIQFLNNFDTATGRSAIVIYDGGEDWDGNGDPWTAAAAWENTDEKLVETILLPKGYTWTPGKLSNVAQADLPLVLCMPDGNMRV